MNTEKIKEVFSDEAFVKNLFALESAAEMQSALKEKGVEMCEEEILAIRELLAKVKNGEITVEQLESGELPEELLEQVSGGGFLTVLAVIAAFGALTGALYGVAKAIS